MVSRFFIDRPIFAAVLSIVITLAGALSLIALPVAQFPSVTPPTVQVTCNYPGASARDQCLTPDALPQRHPSPRRSQGRPMDHRVAAHVRAGPVGASRALDGRRHLST